MDYVLIGITAFVAVATIRQAWQGGGDDPNWDLRWRALDPDEQARLAVAGLSLASTAALDDLEERELAEGFGRREQRLRARLDLALLAALVLAAALLLAGAASLSSFGLIIAAYGALQWAVGSLRDRQIKGTVRLAGEPDAAPAP